ncbi:Rad52/Rad22 family DNA repair protein [Sphingomonas sp. SRS2]|uniref:Rad52/Rad22 family DNA repair protein n=1 Tax=Sphingomonas sp. SRS2 TaxID=133190 RepID=UPI000695FF04|nr:RAD52 family DNA repair protein [Sphingomonas sp. SRS2]
MSFSDAQIDALKAPLSRDAVAQRQQGGSKVSYIEAWHAIAEANRIFGFDAWNRETVELRILGEPNLGKDRNGNDQWRVNYMARVRVTVGDVVREGSGFGQGIDKDVGQAHESGLKEAETDAMKRALMTFGNPFGLALYDKSQSSVADTPKAAEPEPLISDDERAQLLTLADAHHVLLGDVCAMAKIKDLRELEARLFNSAKNWIIKNARKEAA